MSDNFPLTAGSGRNIATDQVTYSGDTADVSLVRLVQVTGAEGSKTVVEYAAHDAAMVANPLPIGGYASAAAPTAVDADGDMVRAWFLRNGSQAATITGGIIPAATTMQNGATANGNGTSLSVSGFPVAVLNIVSSPSMGGGTTINFEASVDDTTWVSITGHQVGVIGSLTATTTADGDFRLNTSGYKSVRARISAYSSGTITVKGYASPLASQPTVVALAAGSNAIGSVTEASASGILTSVQLIDDAVHTDDQARSKSLLIGAVLDDTSTTAITENQAGYLRMSSRRALLVEGVASGTAQPVTVSSGTVTTVSTLTDITNWGNIVDNAGFTDGTTRLLMSGFIFDETAGTALTENDAAAARIDSKRAIVFTLEDGTTRGLRAGVVDETGSSAVDAIAMGGGTPHDSVNSGNPLYLGAEAIAHGTNPTAVAAADRTKLYANRAGIPFVIGGHPNVVTLKHTTITTAVTDAAIVTVSSGLKIVVTRISVTLDNASTVFPTLLIGFAATNTPTTTGVLVAHGGVPAGGGITIGDGSGILGVGADGEDLRVTTTGNATGNGLQICVTYYTIES